MSSSQLSHSSSERQGHAGSRVIPAIMARDLQSLVASRCSFALLGKSWLEREKKGPQEYPPHPPVAWVRPSPEQEPGPAGEGQPSRGRAGTRQPRASREHVPGSTASPRGSWQAAENKLLLVPSGCFSRLGCQLLHARAALAGPGLCSGKGSRCCLRPRPLALPRGIPRQPQPLCQSQKQDDSACSGGMGHGLGTSSCLAALMKKRHHLTTSHGRAFPSWFPPPFAI